MDHNGGLVPQDGALELESAELRFETSSDGRDMQVRRNPIYLKEKESEVLHQS